jgi:hypothetical protein
VDTQGFGGYALGSGPAYPIIAEDRDGAGVYHYKGVQPDSGWWQLKTLWVLSPKAHPPFLVRVTRLDGSGGVGLGGEGRDRQSGTVAELSTGTISSALIHDQSINIADGWATYPGATFVHQAGCYAFQVDGPGFSYSIVFAAEP